MNFKNLLFVLLALVLLEGCSTPPSTTIPDYTTTRVKVNAASSQSAALEAKSRVIEINNSQREIERIPVQLHILRDQLLASRIKLAR